MAINAKIMKDGVDAVTVANVFGGMPTYHAPNGAMLEVAHHLPLNQSAYNAHTHDLLRIRKGTAFTIDDGTTVHRVVFTADSDFDPLNCLDQNADTSTVDALTCGTDYYIFACVGSSGEVQLVVSESATVPESPASEDWNSNNTRKIGGFHFGTVRVVSPTGTPVDSTGAEWGLTGAPAWMQNVISAMVVPNSVWDLTDTKGGLVPHEDGTASVGGSWKGEGYGTYEGKYDRRGCRIWAYIYQATKVSGAFTHGTQSGTATNGGMIGGDFEMSSRYGTFPTTGTEGLTGYNFIEIAQKKGLRILTYEEWLQCAYGNPEGENSANNYGWTATSNTARTRTGCSVDATTGQYSESGIKKYAISAWNLVDMIGNVHDWLAEFSNLDGSTSPSWRDILGDYVGSVYANTASAPIQFIAGGSWYDGSACGSRTLNLTNYPWNVNPHSGSRFVRDAL